MNKKEERMKRRRERHEKEMIPLPLRAVLLIGLSPLILLAIGGNIIYKSIRKRRKFEI